jgi:hypothetical protein
MAVVLADILDTGFPSILRDCLQPCGFDRKSVYTMYETTTGYVAKIVVMARATLDGRSNRFIGPRMQSESMDVRGPPLA